MAEIWLPITGEWQYEVSSLGRVRNVDNPDKMLKLSRRRHQYYFVASRRGKHRIYRLDKLVLGTFDMSFNRHDPQQEVIHLDGDEANCALVNLKAVSRQEKIKIWQERLVYRTPKDRYIEMRDEEGELMKSFKGYTQAVRFLQADGQLPSGDVFLRRGVSRLFYYLNRGSDPQKKVYGHYWRAPLKAGKNAPDRPSDGS